MTRLTSLNPLPVKAPVLGPALAGAAALLVGAASAQAQGTPPVTFVIEAEDYNFGAGQTLPIASQMPYLGGAYKGHADATNRVDFSRTANASFPIYRNDTRVPIMANPDYDRGAWSVAENYRLVLITGGEWFNYTRTFPAAKYRAVAAISHVDLGDGLTQGTLQRITSAATNATQAVSTLGTFRGPGTGAWGLNTLVPLKDTKGNLLVFDLAGTQTLRLVTTSGDFDYIKLVQVLAPSIATQPAATTVAENHATTFSIATAGEDPAFFQWQTNQVNVAGATGASLSLTLPLSADGILVRCVVTNQVGTTLSAEVPLHVVPDIDAPVVAGAQNFGASLVRLRFNEPVSLPSPASPSNFKIDGGASILSAAAGPTSNTLDLTASGIQFGKTYTIKVSGVRDLATTPNTIVAESPVSFTAIDYTLQDIGKVAVAGAVVRNGPGSFDVTGAGADIIGTSDQFQFGFQPLAGDFDLQARVESIDITDPFVNAGLMARDSLAVNGRFAGAFASSAQLGCYFKTRSATNSAASSLTPSPAMPVNYPQTWLRLRRQSGTNFTGFASLDGTAWVQLGVTNLAGMPDTLFVGLSVASELSNVVTHVKFRDVGPTVSTSVIPSPTLASELIGPSSRRTGLIFSEIMYHPKPQAGVTANLEFVEIYNTGAVFEELTGYSLAGGISYAFPDGFQILPGQFVVVAADPAALQAAYGIQGVLGPWQGSLKNSGDTVQLFDAHGAMKLSVTYSPEPPWPVAADGAGPSLTLTRPSYGEGSPKAYGASARIGGTPGQNDLVSLDPRQSVVINEILARPAGLDAGFVELYNTGTGPVSLAGCVLTDDPATNKFTFAAGTQIAAGATLSVTAAELGFALKAYGDTLLLLAPAPSGQVLDAVKFPAQEAGVSFGRTPNGAPGPRRLATPTPGASNSGYRIEDVVINEIMYKPISQDNNDEYLEIYNRSAGSVDLGGWKIVSGVGYTFPLGTLLPPDGYLVIAKNPAQLMTHYTNLTSANTLGAYSGTLANSGDRVALSKPDTLFILDSHNVLQPKAIDVVVTEVTYQTGGRWGQWSAGGGSSLELTDPAADLQQGSSWADSDETQKAPWTTVSLTDVLWNGSGSFGPDHLHINMQGAGECLVDDVEVFKLGGTNLCLNGNFESTLAAQKWELRGNHALSTIDTNGTAYSGSACLHLRAQGDGDTGINAVHRTLQAGLASGVTNTIQAKIRWLAGWPEALFRLKGNWMALPARMIVPTNLGTPGLPNSRRVSNAPPSIYDVTHSPAIPRFNQPVLVTCRVNDPQGIASVSLRYRIDPSTTLTNVVMTDDGQNGDLVAGDGIYSAQIPARSTAAVVAFHIAATDGSPAGVSGTFPATAPVQECLLRWGDTIPTGSFTHYHMWNTAAVDKARNSSIPLDNTYRDMTVVYGNGRIIYNAGFRDKGSPYHSGAGDWAVTVPEDDLLLGVTERVWGSTGNGGTEETGVRGRISAWLAKEMGIPYLHAHEIRVYKNGTEHDPGNITEDNEDPNNYYADGWFPTGQKGELYKIAVWFENDGTDGATGATMEIFNKKLGGLDRERYRWNWQIRANKSANDYTNFLNLVTTLNSAGDYTSAMLNLADVEEWMHVYAYHRITGNWDSWTFNVGQNMFIYQQPGSTKWKLIPWDIDFVLGLGNGTSDPLWGGQDPVANSRLYDNPAFRRMLWRAYEEAISGPLQPSRYAPVIEAYRLAMVRNRITLTTPTPIGPTYIDPRRDYIRSQLHSQDAIQFAVTNNNGSDFVATSPVLVLGGQAPFSVAGISVNGTTYPVRWTSFNTFAISIPLTAGANPMHLVGLDSHGNPIPGMVEDITVTYQGVVAQARDWVVINEILYNPVAPRSSFIELYNASTTIPFDLSGYRLDGVSYVFPDGSLIAPSSYLLIAKSRVDFAAAFGTGIPVWDEFPGSLNSGGERLALVEPGTTPDLDVVVSDVHYKNQLPWPPQADGFGPSLQLIDPLKGSYRVGNWTATPSNSVNQVTPGRANSVRQTLNPFPLAWINEVLPNNVAGPVDNAGDHDPFIEIYNSGTSPLDLTGLYLTDDYTNLTKWPFPAGTTVAAGGFLVVWADGEPGETTPTAPHTSFRLNPSAGSVALVRMQGNPSVPAVVDYLDYSKLPADRSYGSFPDGEPRGRRAFYYITQGAANNPTYPQIPVVINEFMAANVSTTVDPADGKPSDWFELYNSGTTAIDLTGYTLTDTITNATQFVIPPGYSVPAKGFLLVWADGDTQQNVPANADLHVNFKLSETGEALALFSPDGQMVDGFTFGQQYPDISGGRYPDGAAGDLVYMPHPTPRLPNNITGINLAPVITAIPDKSVAEQTLLSFQAHASDANVGQSVTFSLSNPPAGAVIDSVTGLFQWTPDESQGPADYPITILATDNGTPPAQAHITLQVHVSEVNLPPVIAPVAPQSVEAGQALHIVIGANDPDLPVQTLTYSLAPGNPLGSGINPNTGGFSWFPTPEQVGNYTILVVVKDNGSPSLSSTLPLAVEVRPASSGTGPTLQLVPQADKTLTLRWQAVDGTTYRVEYTDSLTTPAWTPLSEVVGANGAATLSGIDATVGSERYYRVVVLQ